MGLTPLSSEWKAEKKATVIPGYRLVTYAENQQ